MLAPIKGYFVGLAQEVRDDWRGLLVVLGLSIAGTFGVPLAVYIITILLRLILIGE